MVQPSRRSSEVEQGIFRVAIAGLVSAYMGYNIIFAGLPDKGHLLVAVSTYLAVAIVFVLVVAYRNPNVVAARYLSLGLDLAMSTFAAYAGGELLAPFFPIYLWIILGHGIRYGKHVLWAGAIFGAAGFGFVTRTNPYWLANPAPALGMVFTLIVIPLFVSALVSKLERSKLEAEQANEAKSRFLANMSHEIRTPLTGIIGLSELLFSSEIEPKHRQQIGAIATSARTLLVLIEDILDISKIESGKVALKIGRFDLGILIEDTAQILAAISSEKGVSLYVDNQLQRTSEFLGDAVRIKQILLNLGGNAVKFTDKGHIRISVEAASSDDIATLVRITVEDTGIGIPPEKLATLFDEFVQGDDSATKGFGGVGLGTTIARRLVTMMQGTIQVSSTLARGSSFQVEIPLSRVPDIQVIKQTKTSGTVIQIVSGDIAVIHAADSALQSWGYISQILKPNEFDQASLNHLKSAELVLFDLNCSPALSAIDGSFESNTFPIVFLNAEGSHTDPLELLAEDSQLLPRNFTKPALFNAVHAALSGARRHTGVAELADYYADTTTRPRRILVTEDKETNRTVLRLILERAGHDVTVVTCGDDALSNLATSEFDIAIVDYQMPDLSGLDVLRLFRFSGQFQQTMPFVILTAHADVRIREECESNGADAFLTKPIDPTSLLEVISQLTQERPGLPRAQTAAIVPNIPDELINADLVEYLTSLYPTDAAMAIMFNRFIKDAYNDVSKMRVAISKLSSTDFRDHAHALLGTSGSVGATEVSRLALLAYSASAEPCDFTKLPNLVEALELAIQKTCTQFMHTLSERRLKHNISQDDASQ